MCVLINAKVLINSHVNHIFLFTCHDFVLHVSFCFYMYVFLFYMYVDDVTCSFGV